MQSLGSQFNFSLPSKKQHAPRTHREDLIEQIRSNINALRVGTTFKPISFMGVKMKVSHLSDFDLGWTHSEALKAKNYSSFFFWSIKPKLEVDPQ